MNKIDKKLNKVIEELDKLKQMNPELKITVETPGSTSTCKIKDANIYVGMGNCIIFDAE